MKISYNWLKELVDLPWTPEVTAEKLTEIGFAVDHVAATGMNISNIVVAKVLTAEKHPNADRLKVTTVFDGKEERVVVCGAPNVAAGQTVPLAKPGTKFPNGLEITVSKIRGVESHGMLCSERELGLSEEHAGIFQLPADAKPGTEVSKLLGGSDTVFDIDVTPNRPDMLSHVGFARELGALAGKKMKATPIAWKKAGTGSTCKVSIREPQQCARYMAKVFHGVKVGPSPDWMARRLTACGIRSINNIVDITNYVLLEWGHPLHAFDLSQLAGPEIIVRFAAEGEKLAALDDRTYDLKPVDLVIADSKQPVAIAGIMGGEPTGVTDSTTDILLESAVFNSAVVRNTSRRLALKSESSIRFEKGTDTQTAEQASLRAASLIVELTGGKAGPADDKFPKKPTPKTITVRQKRIDAVTGLSVKAPVVTKILTDLGLEPKKAKDGWTCKAPLYRKDLQEDVDIIEDVLRFVGYEAVPTTLNPFRIAKVPTEQAKRSTEPLSTFMKGLGFSEALGNSFAEPGLAEQMGHPKSTFVQVANPLSSEESILRPSLLPGLLKAVQINYNNQRNSVMLYEIGKIFLKSSSGLDEKLCFGFVASGEARPVSWESKKQLVDFSYLKGLVNTLNEALGMGWVIKPGSPAVYLHPAQSFEILWRGQSVGRGGMLHPAFAGSLDFKDPVAVCRIDLIGPVQAPKTPIKPYSKYPFVERDIAVLVDKSTPWESLENAVKKTAGELLTAVAPFDVFEGGSLPANQRSIAFRLRLQSHDHTLSESEITGIVDRVKAALKDSCAAQLR